MAGRAEQSSPSLTGCFWDLLRQPREALLLRWNWKSALFSSLCRSALFFFSNLHVGLHAATGAMLTEFAYRGLTAGFYGAITQAFREAEPRGRAVLTVGIGLPVLSHMIEFAMHWLRGTPDLRTSIGVSVVFTVVSTLFNLHVMRKGLLLVGSGSQSLQSDVRSLPGAIVSFLVSGFGLGSAH